VGGLEASWARHSEREQLIFLRHKLGSIMVALSPEQLQELAALYPPEPPAHDGVAGNLDLIQMGDELMREQPRNQKLHVFCRTVERGVAGRNVEQRRTIHHG
jgi:hypothetical protein